jgi:hypothetical protein
MPLNFHPCYGNTLITIITVSYLMCENLLECFNCCVPQYIDTSVRFFVCSLNCSLPVPYCGSIIDDTINFMPHWRLLTMGGCQRKAADLRCDHFEVFFE